MTRFVTSASAPDCALNSCARRPRRERLLATRPYTEVAGPQIVTSDNRIYFSLNEARFEEPELALPFHQRFIRIGHGPGSRVKDLLLGYPERDAEKIRGSLKSISDQLVN